MLAYLDALCAALLARNAIEIFRLLGLPDAKRLPRVVREEAVAIAKAGPDGFLAPIQALHLYYKLSHLVDETAELEERQNPNRKESVRGDQIELQFLARKVS